MPCSASVESCPRCYGKFRVSVLGLLHDVKDICLSVCGVVVYLDTVSHISQTDPQLSRTLDL